MQVGKLLGHQDSYTYIDKDFLDSKIQPGQPNRMDSKTDTL